AVIAKIFARIHWQNLINFGVVPLTLIEAADYGAIEPDDVLVIENLREQVSEHDEVEVQNATQGRNIRTRHQLSPRQLDVLLEGGLISWARRQEAAKGTA